MLNVSEISVRNSELSVRDVAKITKKTPEMVRKWIRSGKLKARKPPFCRDYIIRSEDFKRFWYGDQEGDATNGQGN